MGGSEQVKIVGVQFLSENQIKVTVQNAGTSAVVIVSAKVNDEVIVATTPEDPTIDAGEQETITFSYNWTSGNSYNVGVVTKAGNVFTYYATAPSSS